jgi:hypothetical protein
MGNGPHAIRHSQCGREWEELQLIGFHYRDRPIGPAFAGQLDVRIPPIDIIRMRS